MPPLQNITLHSILIQLHPNKHTTQGHGFVGDSHEGMESTGWIEGASIQPVVLN